VAQNSYTIGLAAVSQKDATVHRVTVYASCSGRHDVWQGNINILQHLQLDLADLALILSFS